jgi:acetyl coenzyme A synthetase (ADP forming)-like protein
MKLETFLRPRSVAVIGASREPGKVGHRVLRNIIAGGFEGEVYPVNPKADEILGIRCYRSVVEIPDDVELGVIVVPAKLVPGVVEECGRKGVKGVVVISAGFSETGMEGLELERELVGICRQYGMRMLGPNCLGIINTWWKINASFSGASPMPGNIALVSQSGALGSAILNWAINRNVGLSNFVSVGNEADLTFADFVEALAEEDRVRVIGLYVEGVKEGRRFVDVCEKVVRKKPIVALKAGKTEVGMKAVMSHTGSLAGSDVAFTEACRKAGVIRVGRMEELFELVTGFGTQPPMRGRSVLIVTNGGGPGVLAADACEESGLQMPLLEEEIREKLRESLPPHASVHNPIDLVGDADALRYRVALTAGLRSEKINGAIVIVTPQAMTPVEEIAAEILKIKREFGDKPILPVFMGISGSPIEILRKNGLPNFEFPESAAFVMRKMYDYFVTVTAPEEEPPMKDIDERAIAEVLEKASRERRVVLTIEECMKVAEACGIRMPPAGVAKSREEAVKVAERIGYPVVLKVVSPDIIHKTDVGGVVLNVKSAEEVERSYDTILRRVRVTMPEARIAGVLVCKMVLTGKEVIVGSVRDVQFGPLVMFGLGGIYVNFLRDVSHRLCPVTQKEAAEMVREIRAYPLLAGVRGEAPADIEALVDVILRVSSVMQRFERIMEMEINPLCVYEKGKGCLAVDIRITVEKGAE